MDDYFMIFASDPQFSWNYCSDYSTSWNGWNFSAARLLNMHDYGADASNSTFTEPPSVLL